MMGKYVLANPWQAEARNLWSFLGVAMEIKFRLDLLAAAGEGKPACAQGFEVRATARASSQEHTHGQGMHVVPVHYKHLNTVRGQRLGNSADLFGNAFLRLCAPYPGSFSLRPSRRQPVAASSMLGQSSPLTWSMSLSFAFAGFMWHVVTAQRMLPPQHSDTVSCTTACSQSGRPTLGTLPFVSSFSQAAECSAESGARLPLPLDFRSLLELIPRCMMGCLPSSSALSSSHCCLHGLNPVECTM